MSVQIPGVHTRASDTNFHNVNAWAVHRAIADLELRHAACDTAIAKIAIEGQIDALKRVLDELNDIPRRRLLLKQMIGETQQRLYEVQKSLPHP